MMQLLNGKVRNPLTLSPKELITPQWLINSIRYIFGTLSHTPYGLYTPRFKLLLPLDYVGTAQSSILVPWNLQAICRSLFHTCVRNTQQHVATYATSSSLSFAFIFLHLIERRHHKFKILLTKSWFCYYLKVLHHPSKSIPLSSNFYSNYNYYYYWWPPNWREYPT